MRTVLRKLASLVLATAALASVPTGALGVPNLTIGDTTVQEGAGTATFTVTLSENPASAVTVDFATFDLTAVSGPASDYASSSGTLTFNPGGDLVQAITITIHEDFFAELTETFGVLLSNPVNATIVGPSSATGTILDNDPNPSVSIGDVTASEGDTGTTDFFFTVTLSEASGKPVTVQYALAAGSATVAGNDFVTTSGTLTIAAGDTNATIAVQVNGDTASEPDETFFVHLTAATNAAITDATGLGLILNDDAAPELSISSATIVEGHAGAAMMAFAVTLSPASGQTVSVDYSTADDTATTANSDYAPASGTLFFFPGETVKYIYVAVNGDTSVEADEQFGVALTNATGGAGVSATNGSATGTILNDDGVASLAIADATVTEGQSGTVTARFIVTLSPIQSSTMTVDYATANGTAVAPGDYASLGNTTLTFLPGETVKAIDVAVAGDLLAESNETFTVVLSNASSGVQISRAAATGTILDDDALPSLSIGNATVVEGLSGTVDAVFALSLSASSPSTVTVTCATVDGTARAGQDFTAVSTLVTFDPGQTSRTCTVPVTGDNVHEPDETFLVVLSGATNASISGGTGVGTIQNDDLQPTLSIGNATVTEGNSGTVDAVFTVTLSRAAWEAITVDYTTANGTATAGLDYTAGSGTLTFAPGQTERTVAVAVHGDIIDELDETFTVQLTAATGATIGSGLGTGTITDDDPEPGISIGGASVVEGNTGSVFMAFPLTLSHPSWATVTVDCVTQDNSAVAPGDYMSASYLITFNPGETSKTCAIAVNGDLASEGNESFYVNLANASGAYIAAFTGVGVIVDDDPQPPIVTISDVFVSEGNSGTLDAVFTVSLSSPMPMAVSVAYATANGSAIAPADYTAQSGTLFFAPLATTQTISVPIVGDAFSEPHESFFVVLSNPSGVVILDGTAMGMILNDDDYVLSVARAGTGSGAVSSSPAGISCGATCSATIATGTLVTLTASPGPGSAFSGWSGACTGTDACIVTMDADKYVTASFSTSSASVRFDFSGDGRADVLWRDASGGLNYQWQMNGLALAISGQGYMPSVPASWTVAGRGDVNGDGLADVLWRDTGGLDYLWLVNGLGLASQGYLPTVPNPWVVVGLGDVNGDGRADVLWRNPASGQNYVWMMNGFTIVTQGYLPSIAGTDWEVGAVADMNGDGRADVFWRNKATGQNYLWLLNGLGIQSQGYLSPVTPAADWEVVASPDANGDGRADVFWRNKVTGQNYVWLMNGVAIASQAYLPTVADTNWKVVAFGDFSGDGRGDILWRNASSGFNYVWMLDGIAISSQGYLPAVAGTNWVPVKQ